MTTEEETSEENDNDDEVHDNSHFPTNGSNIDRSNSELEHFQHTSPNLQTNAVPNESFHEDGVIPDNTTHQPKLEKNISTNRIHGNGSLKIVLTKLRLYKTME